MGRRLAWYARAIGAGIALVLTGLVVLLGLVLVLVFGSDDTLRGRSTPISGPGPAVVTDPALLTWVGPVYHLTATTGADEPEVFLGVAPSGEVTAYLGDVATATLTAAGFPIGDPAVRTTPATGDATTVGPPAEQALWRPVSRTSAPTETSIAWHSRPGAWSFALVRADGAGPVSANLAWAVEIPHVFAVGVVLLVLGVALFAVVVGVLVRRSRRRRREAARAGRRPETIDLRDAPGAPAADTRGGADGGTGPLDLPGPGSGLGTAGDLGRRELQHSQAVDPPGRSGTLTLASPTGAGSRRAAREAASARVSRMRARALLAGAAGTALVVLVAVTLLVPVDRNPGRLLASPVPVTSPDRAATTLTRYVDTVREANATRDASALATVEAGAALRTDSAAQTISRYLSPESSTLTPFTVVEPTWWIPNGSGYPRVFVTDGRMQQQDRSGDAVGDPSSDHSLMVFRQDAAGDPWLQVYAVRALPEVADALPQPDPAQDGLIGPLPATAEAVVTDWARQLATTGSDEGGGMAGSTAGAAADAADPATAVVEGDAFLAATRAGVAAFFSAVSSTHTVTEQVNPGPDDPVALRARDGGMLLFFSTELVRTVQPKDPRDKRTWITLSDNAEALLGRPTAQELTMTWTQQWLALVPPSGEGPARIVGQLSWPTEARQP